MIYRELQVFGVGVQCFGQSVCQCVVGRKQKCRNAAQSELFMMQEVAQLLSMINVGIAGYIVRWREGRKEAAHCI